MYLNFRRSFWVWKHKNFKKKVLMSIWENAVFVSCSSPIKFIVSKPKMFYCWFPDSTQTSIQTFEYDLTLSLLTLFSVKLLFFNTGFRYKVIFSFERHPAVLEYLLIFNWVQCAACRHKGIWSSLQHVLFFLLYIFHLLQYSSCAMGWPRCVHNCCSG